jgi:hypothetical protein
MKHALKPTAADPAEEVEIAEAAAEEEAGSFNKKSLIL